MKIEFFETEVGLDKKAAQGGIYHIERENGGKSSLLFTVK